MIKLSAKIKNCALSETLRLDTLAKEMQSRGENVINLAAGQPDFETFSEVKNAIKKAVIKGNNKYSAPAGMPLLKESVVGLIRRDYGIKYQSNEIIITNGAKQGLYSLFQVLLNKGDEVIIPIPAWVSYVEQVKLAVGRPVLVKTSKNFHLDIQEIKNNITKKTKLIVLNSPNNPTGAVYSKQELLALNKLIFHKNIFIISDDPYRYILFKKKFYSFASINKDQAIIVDSISKSHSVPGWRLGWVAGPLEIISALAKLQGQISGNVCNLAQIAGIKALSLPKNIINPWVKEYNKRRNFLKIELSKIPELSYIAPEGAFYFFINITKISNNSVNFCEQLLKKEKLVLVPGKAFGLDGYVRLSFANSMKDLIEAIKRLNKYINNYGK